jgi:hypothetical protein
MVIVLSAATASGDESLSCYYNQTQERTGTRVAWVTLYMDRGHVTGVSDYNAIGAGPNGGGSICGFEASALDGRTGRGTSQLARTGIIERRDPTIDISMGSSESTCTFFQGGPPEPVNGPP